jgi:hypothetical protein
VTTAGRATLFVGVCLAVIGGVFGLLPLTDQVSSGAPLHIACGSALRGLADPPPACAQILQRTGAIALGFIGSGIVVMAAGAIFGRTRSA